MDLLGRNCCPTRFSAQVFRGGAGLQRVNPLGTGSLRPVAIETAAEATKLSELWM